MNTKHPSVNNCFCRDKIRVFCRERVHVTPEIRFYADEILADIDGSSITHITAEEFASSSPESRAGPWIRATDARRQSGEPIEAIVAAARWSWDVRAVMAGYTSVLSPQLSAKHSVAGVKFREALTDGMPRPWHHLVQCIPDRAFWSKHLLRFAALPVSSTSIGCISEAVRAIGVSQKTCEIFAFLRSFPPLDNYFDSLLGSVPVGAASALQRTWKACMLHEKRASRDYGMCIDFNYHAVWAYLSSPRDGDMPVEITPRLLSASEDDEGIDLVSYLADTSHLAEAYGLTQAALAAALSEWYSHYAARGLRCVQVAASQIAVSDEATFISRVLPAFERLAPWPSAAATLASELFARTDVPASTLLKVAREIIDTFPSLEPVVNATAPVAARRKIEEGIKEAVLRGVASTSEAA